MKKVIVLCLLIMAANATGSGNVEISDGKLKILSADASKELQVYRVDDDAYIDWATGTLYLDGGSIAFDNQSRGNSKLFWDDANSTLIVYIIDVNYIDTNDVNSITGTFTGDVTLSSMTEGSVLFTGSGGLISEDNSTLFWHDANDDLGIGTNSPKQRLSIGSNDGSDRMDIYHNNTDAIIETTDGHIIARSIEDTNSNTYLSIRGNGTGRGFVRSYDEDNAEYASFDCVGGVGRFYTEGSSPSYFSLMHNAHSSVRCFDNAATGETKELIIRGYRDNDSLRSLEIGVGIDANDTASFDGVSNYLFDGTVEAVTLTEGGNAVYSSDETPGGELGGTFASFTVDATHSGSAHHAAVTLTGQDYLTLSTQQITIGEIEPDDLAASDFGPFTSNGTTSTLDTLAQAWDMGSQNLTNVNIDSGTINGITDLAIADGGTGASTAAGILANLSGQASAAFSWNSQNLTNIGTIGSGTITSSGSLVIADAGNIGSVSDTDAITIEADGDVVLTQSLILGGAGPLDLTNNCISASDVIDVKPNGDNDDYIEFSTSDNAPRIHGVGGDLYIYADGGNIRFWNDNLITTGDITCTDFDCDKFELTESGKQTIKFEHRDGTHALGITGQTATHMICEFGNGQPNGKDYVSYFKFYNKGNADDQTDKEYIQMGAGLTNYVFYTYADGNGVLLPVLFSHEGLESLKIDTTGEIYMAQAVDDALSNLRDPYWDSTDGQIGYDSSSARDKEQIVDLTDSDTEFLYDLQPRKYNKIGGFDNEIGLIAEEVAVVGETIPNLISYRRERLTKEEYSEVDEGIVTVTTGYDITDEPETVNYSRLIVPMLKEIQKQRAAIEALEARVQKLENR